MKRTRKRRKKSTRALLLALYIMAAGLLLYHVHPLVHALGKGREILEIGAGDDEVKAILSENGVLTISGNGRTKDYTADTAPFAEYGDRITTVKIEEGILGIGDYLFYNCGNLKGSLVLPSTVIWIGDEAFSGDSRETAPRFTSVSSRFTQAEIARLKPGAEIPTTSEEESGTVPQATPGEAESEPKETTGNGTEEKLPADGSGSQSTEAEDQTASGTDGAEPTEEGPDGTESTAAGMDGTETTAEGPDGTEPSAEEPAQTELPEKSPETASTNRESSQTEEGEGTFTMAAGRFSGLFRGFRLNSAETAASEAEETWESDTYGPEETSRTSTEAPVEKETSSKPAATPSTPQSTEADEEETEPTEEFSEDGMLSNNLYEGVTAASKVKGSEREYYTFEIITSQLIGNEMFYSGQKGVYDCDPENTSFTDAAEQAGYRKADGYVEVDMEGIRGTYPIMGGMLTDPELPEEIEKPDNGGDPLFANSFIGWTLEREWETLGYEAPVYAPGFDIPVEDGAKVITLYANWEKTCIIDPEVKVQAEENRTTYTLIDGNTGTTVPGADGYQIHYQWQICRPVGTEGRQQTAALEEADGLLIDDMGENLSSSEGPDEIGPGIEKTDPETQPEQLLSDLRPADPSDESNWENLEGETEAVCVRNAEKDDTASYFRVMMSVDRASYFRSASEPVTLYSDPVAGKTVLQKIAVIYEPGDGAAGTAPVSEPVTDGFNLAPQPNTFTRDDGQVFTGWAVSLSGTAAVKQDGTAVGEGEKIASTTALTLHAEAAAVNPSITLTAQWSQAVTVWLDGMNGDDGRDGSSASAAVRTLARAYALLPDTGTVWTNRIMLCGNYSISGNTAIAPKPATITSTKISTTEPLLTFAANSITTIQSDTTFENINLKYNQTGYWNNPYGIYAAGHTLTMGMGIDTSGDFQLLGGSYNTNLDGDSNLIVCSGTYFSVSGGSWNGTTKDTHITVYGGYIDRVHAGSIHRASTPSLNSSVILGSTHVQIYGGTVSLMFGGNRYGTVKGEGHDYGTKVEVLGGSAALVAGGPHSGNEGQVNKKAWVRVVNAEITDHLVGAGVDANLSTTRFPLMDGVKIEVINSTVRGSLYGGGDDTFMPRNKPSVNGDIDIVIDRSTIEGNVYGGARLGPVQSQVSIHVTDSTVVGVFGAGAGGSGGTADVSGSVKIVADGNSSIENIYGGADSNGTVAGGTDITIVDAKVGAVYGAGKGSSTRVSGNTKIAVQNGSQITGNVYGGGESGASGGSEIAVSGGVIDGSIFGGGNNIGTGSARITVTGTPVIKTGIYGGSNYSGSTTSAVISVSGSVAGSIYGGGYGSGTTVTTSEISVGDGAAVAGNIFGGGDQGKVVNTSIDLNGGTVSKVFGGGNQVGVSGTVTVKSNAGSTAESIYGGANASGTTETPSVTVAGTVTDVYGGGLGSGTTTTSPVVTVMTGASVTGNLFGGGDAGAVTGGSTVNIEGGTISAVYGGGNAVGVDGNVTVQTKTGSAITSLYGGSNSTGSVTGPAITIQGAVTNLYGAGKGRETITSAPAVTAETGAVISSLYGGGEQGQTQDGTTVCLNSGSQAEYVFGGGSQADISGVSHVTVESGARAGTVYGGSNSSGTVASPVLTIRGTAGNVYGAGKGNQTITTAPTVTVDDGAAATCLYGGGEEGQTQGGTTIALKSGSRAEEVFGGGNAAGVTGAVSLTAEHGSRVQKLYGGSNSTGVVENVTVTVDGTVGGNGAAGTADGPGAVYGGGLGEQTSTGTPTVVIDSKGVVTGEVFGGGARGPVTGNTTVILKPSGNMVGNVYAGGDAAAVNGSTRLEASDGFVLDGSLFGGGKGATAEIKTDTRVIVFAHVTGNVFGGGAEGAVKGSTHVDIAKGVVDGDGLDTGNVFGGSDKAKVGGNTQVHIGWEAAKGTETPVTGASLIIKGTVFGGGNTTDNGSTFDASDPFVLGNSEVSVDATGYDTANFNIEKNIFGDGNMCTVKGSRTVTIKDYKAIGGQANTSIQRADTLIIENSQVELTGAVDSANLVPTIAYSLNRIDSLIMKGGTTLKLQAPVNLVKHLKSVDGSGDPVTTTATDTAAVPLSPENRIDIQQGVQMELRTSEDVTTAEYGQVTGYMILDVYDKEAANIESGIYVLGNYAADEALGGFLYGSGTSQYKKIVPTTDSRTWRNWAIGTDMKRTAILTMSNKPAGEKIIQLESPWPADGSSYQLVKNSVEISATLTDGSIFYIKDPSAISSTDPLNTTLGLSILTGNQGWVSQMCAGYITGDSAAGASGGGFGGISAQSMQTINNRSVKPLIQIELTNRAGLTDGDPVGEYPLTVQFQMENVKKLSDGSLSKLGTLTVLLQIRRDAAQNYEDILLSTGKEYTRGTQTYAFDTAGGTGGGAGVTITKQSSVTLQYARKRDDETEGARDHRLSFSTDTTPSSPGNPERLPEGVKILLVDRADTYPVYAHYTVPSGGVAEVLLSEFVKNGTANDRYNRTFSQNERENYLFILDFEDVPDYGRDRLCVTFEPVYAGSMTVKPARIVFNITSDPKVYKQASSEATGEDGEGKVYDRDGAIPFTLTIYSNTVLGIDTTGTVREMGARLRLKNRDVGVYVPVPTDWLVTSEGKTYQSSGGSVTVPLASGMIDTTVGLEIGMKQNSLPAGRYQWEIHLTASALSAYPGSLTDTPLYLNFDIADKQYSIEAANRTASVSRLYPAESEEPRLPMQLRVRLKADNGATTDDVTQRVSLWKKDSSTGLYENIDFNTLYSGLSGLSQTYSWNEVNDFDYALNQSLPEGTYRLKFELVQNESGVERILTYDTENFIVTPK